MTLQGFLALAEPVADGRTPHPFWTFPFVALLLAIALLDAVRRPAYRL